MKIAEFAQAVMSAIINDLDLDKDQFSLSPIALEETKADDPDYWVGVQYAYLTSQKPPTRLQIVFGDQRLGLVTPGSELANSRTSITRTEMLVNWMDQYNDHPDPITKTHLIELIHLMDSNGFDFYAIPWEKEFELMEKSKRDELAGLTGLFFPVFHFHRPDVDYDVIVRCEPVIQIDNGSD